MSGFGASVLAHTPKVSPGLPVRGIQAAYDPGVDRVPSLATIRHHLERMRALGIVDSSLGRERRYWRLVDSVLDVPQSEVSA